MPEPAWHRRARRARTRSRTLLRAVGSGWLKVPAHRIVAAEQLLAAHHSRNMPPKSPPWKCQQCGTVVKGTLEFCCGRCGSHWQSTPPEPTYQGDWYADQGQWQGRGQRLKSPRGHTPRGQRQKDSGQNDQRPAAKAKGKGKGKDLSDRLAAALPAAPMAPNAPPPPRPAEAAPAATDGEAQKALDCLLAVLAKQDRAQLPAEVQKMIGETQAQDAKRLTKALHQQTSKQGSARKELAKLREDRLAFAGQWQLYLEGLVAMLDTQLTARDATLLEYNNKEQALVTQVNEALAEIARLQGLMAGDRHTEEHSGQDEVALAPTPLPAKEVLTSLQGALTSTKQMVMKMAGKRRAVEAPTAVDDSDDELMQDAKDLAKETEVQAKLNLSLAALSGGGSSAPSQSPPG